MVIFAWFIQVKQASGGDHLQRHSCKCGNYSKLMPMRRVGGDDDNDPDSDNDDE